MRKSCSVSLKTLLSTALPRIKALIVLLLFSCSGLSAEEKPFVIVIPSYNNEAYCERNLASVFKQNYHNYRVIYADDCSTDQTYEKVKEQIGAAGQSSRVTLVRNEKNYGPMGNIYRCIQSCKDHEIVVMLDGDDYFFDAHVLETLNSAYADPDVWVTYGNCCMHPVDPNQTPYGIIRPVSSDILSKGKVRSNIGKYQFPFTHLKTFYASLFKQIKKEDLTWNGNFFEATADQAFMLPIVDMAGAHTRFIPQVLYVYNASSPLNEHKVRAKRQRACRDYIWSLPSYPLLAALHFGLQTEKKSVADLVLFSYNRPLQLYACLESLERYVQGAGQIAVIYRASEEKYEEGYRLVKAAFPKAIYLKQSSKPEQDFKPFVLQAAFDSSSKYVAFVVDDIIVKDAIDLRECAAALENTGAYGFYLRLGKQVDFCQPMNMYQGVPPLVEVQKEIFAWKFSDGKGDWIYPNSVDMTLYKKAEIQKTLESFKFRTPNELEARWAQKANNSKTGLCYAKSKIVNIPLNLVNTMYNNRHMEGYAPELLLERFMQGEKIDITPLFQIENRSPHIEYHPTFIKR